MSGAKCLNNHKLFRNANRRSSGWYLFIGVSVGVVLAIARAFSPRCRVTATFRCADGRTLHLRKATAVEPHQKPIYDALAIQPDAGGFVKKVI